MTDVVTTESRRARVASVVSIFTSSGTLICCALPALLVTLGAGAALSGLVATVPQIVWLSTHKGWVFGLATAMLLIAGILQWRARFAPCPADPKLALACARTRRASAMIYAVSILLLIIGAVFAFLLPILSG